MRKKYGSFNSEMAIRACGLNGHPCIGVRFDSVVTVKSLEFFRKAGSTKDVDRI